MLLHQDLTDVIIKCFYKVYNEPGFGFLEKVCENALLTKLGNNGLDAAGIVVENKIIIEIKAGENGLVEEQELQLINYLRATDKEAGSLLSFGKKPALRRKIFTNNNKQLGRDHC